MPAENLVGRTYPRLSRLAPHLLFHNLMLQRAREFYSGPGRSSALVRAIIGSAGLRFLGMGFGFLVGVQLARGLGPSDYGVYGLAMSIIAVLMVPTEFGLPQLVTREIAAAQSNGETTLLPQLLGWSGKFMLVNLLVLTAIGVMVALSRSFDFSQQLQDSLWLGLLLLPIVATSNILSAALRGLNRIVEGQVAELLIRPAVLSVTLFVAALWLGDAPLTPSLAMLLNVVAAMIGVLFVAGILRRHLKHSATQKVKSRATDKGWLTSAIPLALGDGMRILSGHLAILVLGAMAPTEDVGMYRVAFGVYAVATLPSALLNMACSPMLAALHEEGRRDAIQRLNGWMALFLTAAALLCMAPFAVAGQQIISVIFGPSFADSNSILLVLLAGEILSSLLGHPTIVLNMLRHDRAVTRFSLVSLLVNVCMCLVLVPLWGGVGAATAVASAQIVWRLLASRYAARELGLETSCLAWMKK